MVVLASGERGKEELMFSGDRVQICKMKKN